MRLDDTAKKRSGRADVIHESNYLLHTSTFSISESAYRAACTQADTDTLRTGPNYKNKKCQKRYSSIAKQEQHKTKLWSQK